MKFNIKSKKGFTLIELLVVIGILAVLAAIAIPSVAGLIDRANVSSDNTNAGEMTNAMERFVSEYEMYCQDVQSGLVDVNNLNASQSRIYNVLGTTDWNDIKKIEDGGCNSIAIDKDTKYPANKYTVIKVIENYEKTSSSTFDPKQSDKHYFYSPSTGTVTVADVASGYASLNAKLLNGTDGSGNSLTYTTEWIDITSDNDILYCSLVYASKISGQSAAKFYFHIPEATFDYDNSILYITHNGEQRQVKSAAMIRGNSGKLKEGQEFTLETMDLIGGKKTNFGINSSTVEPLTPYEQAHGTFSFVAKYTVADEVKDYILIKRMVFELDNGEIIYTQPLYTVYNDLPFDLYY